MSDSKWNYEFTKEAKKDFDALDHHQQVIVLRVLKKVSSNPLPQSQGGYGISLGNRHGYDLTGCCEIKLRGQNLRIIYQLIHEKMIMLNIAIDQRSDLKAYKIAYRRLHNK